MKKRLAKLLIICIVFAICPVAQFNFPQVTQAAVLSYEKSYSIRYENHTNIPSTIQYSEWSDENNQYYAGTLTINPQKVIALSQGSILIMTYEGTLYPVKAE